MAKNTSTRSAGRKHHWFARRQVYLRAGQDSQYVELSPMLQVGVALGMLAFVLLLAGASYAAFTGLAGQRQEAELLARLESTEQALVDVERERDAAREDTARITHLEAALADAKALADDASSQIDAEALEAELSQTKEQLDDLQLRFSEAKADNAALQARFEAEVSATSDASAKTAEEASSLHAQLEQAFSELEVLQEERDTALSKLDTALDEKVERDETIDRNTALLKAATAEIERLQETVQRAESEAGDQAEGREAALARLEEAAAAQRSLEGDVATLQAQLEDARTQAGEREATVAKLDEALATRADLEREVTDLRAQLDALQANAETMEATASAAEQEAKTAGDAALHARSIVAGLQEAELLETIDGLRAQLTADAPAPENGRITEAADDIEALRDRAALAEAEIERLLLSGLKADEEPAETETPSSAEPADPSETERLRAELLSAQADIIKLTADVRAAKQRLAEQASEEGGPAVQPANAAKLEQQLASTRSRVQQLNKALSDAKLREVAIDLALISVIPTPSPPAPR